MKQFMKKIFLTSLFLFVSLFFVPPASAHVLITDKNIGAVMHTDPDDDPISGKQTSFFFEFKDTTNKFNPADCDCTFAISEKGKQIYSQPLYQNIQKPTLTNAVVFYTFPQKDDYHVTVTGKPNTDGEFQSFTLTYDVPVNKTSDQLTDDHSSSGSSGSSLYLWIGFFIILISFTGFVLYNRKKSSKKHEEVSKK